MVVDPKDDTSNWNSYRIMHHIIAPDNEMAHEVIDNKCFLTKIRMTDDKKTHEMIAIILAISYHKIRPL